MGFKCAPQLLGLTIGEPPVKTNEKTGKKYKNRHRANGEAIAKEMFEERASRSETLDRSRSRLNEYEGFTSGEDCWADMLNDVAEYKMPVKLKNGQTAYRKLGGRQLAELVPGWSIILNPPPEMTVGWTDADYDRFDADGMEVLAEICPIFKPKNYKGKAIHRDEGREDVNGEYGRHTHYIGNCWDGEGRYCGSVINGLLYDEINRRFPEMMRAKGWDLDDLDVTDWEKLNEKDENGEFVNQDYRAEREEKRKNKGRSINQVIEDDRNAARNAKLEAQQLKDEAQAERDEAEKMGRGIGKIVSTVRGTRRQIRDDKAAADEAEEQRRKAEARAEAARRGLDTIHTIRATEIEAHEKAMAEGREELEQLRENIKASRTEAQEARVDAQEAVRARQEYNAAVDGKAKLTAEIEALTGRRDRLKNEVSKLAAQSEDIAKVKRAISEMMMAGRSYLPDEFKFSRKMLEAMRQAKENEHPGPTHVEGPTR